MENNNDVFMLGGHEFHSRFILGSGKYNSPPDPCGSRICRCRDRHARPAPCQYQTRREYSGLYPEERNAAAEHIRRKKCRGSNPYRPPRP